MTNQQKKVFAVGELLWDLLPSGKVPGGAPGNFAFRLKNLGVPVFFTSRVGNDDLGKEALAVFEQHGLSTEGIQVDSEHPTGTVPVTLDAAGTPDFTIIQDVAYDYLELNDTLLKEASEASVICFGTLVQRSRQTRRTLYSLIEIAENAVRLLDINLRRDCWNKKTVESSLQLTDILKLNEDEAKILSEIYAFEFSSLRQFASEMIGRFGLQACLITRAERGIYGLDEKGAEADIPGISVKVVDTIGSGDSFTAGFVKQFLEGKPLYECCEYGNRIGALVAATKGGMTPIEA